MFPEPHGACSPTTSIRGRGFRSTDDLLDILAAQRNCTLWCHSLCVRVEMSPLEVVLAAAPVSASLLLGAPPPTPHTPPLSHSSSPR